MNKHFFEYMMEFERQLLRCDLGRDRIVNTERQKNINLMDMAYSMGWEIDSPVIGAIDYYGFIRKTTGLIEKGHTINSRVLIAPVINFQSIKMSDLVRVDSRLVTFFPEYKNVILTLRGFTRGEYEL